MKNSQNKQSTSSKLQLKKFQVAKINSPKYIHGGSVNNDEFSGLKTSPTKIFLP